VCAGSLLSGTIDEPVTTVQTRKQITESTTARTSGGLWHVGHERLYQPWGLPGSSHTASV